MAWNTFSGSTPAFVARVIASPTAAMFSATIIWLASLVVFPLPRSPQRTAEAPITKSISLYFSKTFSLPPTMIAMVPSTAFGSPPLTGASSISMPFSARAFPTSWDTRGAIELMSISVFPEAAASIIPFSPRATVFTWGELGSMVMMRSVCSVTSFGEPAADAPPEVSSLTASWLMSWTTRS